MENWKINLMIFGTFTLVIGVISFNQYKYIRKDLKQNWDI